MASDVLEKVRLDKWLWSVRIFKTRSLATEVCKAGNVKSDGKTLKPSTLLTGGEEIRVKKNGFNMIYRVDRLIQKRVGAPIAIECYTDLTPEDELNKYKDWFIGKGRAEMRQKGEGRPTKKQRRILDDYKVNQYFDEED